MIKLVDRAELMKEREHKLKQEEARRLEKEKKKAEAEAKAAKNKVPPWEMFKGDTDKYSKFDDKVSLKKNTNTLVLTNKGQSKSASLVLTLICTGILTSFGP